MKFFVFILLTISFCSNATSSDLSAFLNLKKAEEDAQINQIREQQDIRVKTMKDAAIHLGMQIGFNEEIRSIQDNLNEMNQSLDSVFDFNAIMRSTNAGKHSMFLLPGIVTEEDGKVVISDDGTKVTTTEKKIVKVKDETFVSTPPTWQSYLLSSQQSKVQKPFNAILPENKDEEKLWREWVLKGYSLGIEQANSEIIAKAQKLRLNFVGRVKYLRYRLDNTIEGPQLSLSNEGVIFSDNELLLNTDFYNINSPSKFNQKTGEWEIMSIDTREGYRNHE